MLGFLLFIFRGSLEQTVFREFFLRFKLHWLFKQMWGETSCFLSNIFKVLTLQSKNIHSMYRLILHLFCLPDGKPIFFFLLKEKKDRKRREGGMEGRRKEILKA